MTLFALIIDLILTIPLSFIILHFSQKKDNYLNLCLIPTIYIIIISAIFPILKNNIFLIPIFEFFIRNFYITNIKEDFISNRLSTIIGIASILISLFTYNFFISKVNNVFPTAEEIRPLIWIFITYLIYNMVKNNSFNNINTKSFENKKEYIVMQYAKYKNLYSTIINSKNEEVNKLVYSIMIYETYLTPPLYRQIKIYKNRLLNKPVKYGIMQVISPIPLTDIESIKLTIKDIEKKLKKDNNIDNYLKKLNLEKQKNIKLIYNEINNFDNK